MTPVRRWRANLLLVVGTLVVAEGFLRLATWSDKRIDALLSPPDAIPAYLPDSNLLGRGNPRWPDHDSRGFRNAVAVDQANTVVLGDSHTYGAGVNREQTWPALMNAATGDVYNMAFSGWGPMQGYLLLNQALELKPRVVVFALYFGNDFVDSYKDLLKRPELRHFIPDSLTDTTAALERLHPISEQATALFSLADTSKVVVPSGIAWSGRRLLSQYSKLYGLGRAVRSALSGQPAGPALLSRDLDQALARMREDQRRLVLVYRGPEWKTLLTPSYRNLVVDDRDPRVRAGVEATKTMLWQMDSVCRARSVRFLVAMLPTKETVFSSRVPLAERSTALDSLVRNEKKLHDEMIGWMDSRQMRYRDLLPALQASREQPYFPDADGHPNPVGHQVIGATMRAALEDLH